MGKRGRQVVGFRRGAILKLQSVQSPGACSATWLRRASSSRLNGAMSDWHSPRSIRRVTSPRNSGLPLLLFLCCCSLPLSLGQESAAIVCREVASAGLRDIGLRGTGKCAARFAPLPPSSAVGLAVPSDSGVVICLSLSRLPSLSLSLFLALSL